LIGEARSVRKGRALERVKEKRWHKAFVSQGTSDPGCRPILVLRSDLMGTREAEELLLIEEADAWFEYLEATRGQTEPRYREVEPWAWARLSQRLRAVRTKRAKLRPAAEAA